MTSHTYRVSVGPVNEMRYERVSSSTAAFALLGEALTLLAESHLRISGLRVIRDDLARVANHRGSFARFFTVNGRRWHALVVAEREDEDGPDLGR